MTRQSPLRSVTIDKVFKAVQEWPELLELFDDVYFLAWMDSNYDVSHGQGMMNPFAEGLFKH